jgi:hypothetical protein
MRVQKSKTRQKLKSEKTVLCPETLLKMPFKNSISAYEGIVGEMTFACLMSRLTGHDAVLSCLGFQPEKPKVTGYLEATKASFAIHVVCVQIRKRRGSNESISFR